MNVNLTTLDLILDFLIKNVLNNYKDYFTILVLIVCLFLIGMSFVYNYKTEISKLLKN